MRAIKLILGAGLAVSFAGTLAMADEANLPPAAPAPTPAPAPVWLESPFTMTASIVDVKTGASKEAFTLAGTGRVLKNGFKSELVIGGVTTKCNFTGQLSDSKTHITQYYCFLEEQTLLPMLEAQVPATEESTRATALLTSYLEQDTMRSVLVLIGADSRDPLYTEQTNHYLEPKAKLERVDIKVSIAH